MLDDKEDISKTISTIRKHNSDKWNNIHYQKSIVAFIDVLGFKNIISNSDINIPKKLLRQWDLSSLIYQHASVKQRIIDDYGEFEVNYSLISDSVIISCALLSDNSFYTFIGMLQTFILNLFSDNSIFFCRAGISIGDLFHEGNTVFGPALVDAVELEKKARYPRHVITHRDLETIRSLSNNDDDINNFISHYFIKDDISGDYYFDYLTRLLDSHRNKGGHVNTEFVKTLKSIKSEIYRMLNYSEGGILEKYNWLKDYYNAFIKGIYQNHPQYIEELTIA